MPSFNYKNVKHPENGFDVKLENNKPIIVRPEDKSIRFWFHEKSESEQTDEMIYIWVKLENSDYGLLGHECAPDHISDYKRTDLLYIYISPDKHTAKCFVYDVKRKMETKKMILGLIKQWNATMKFARNMVSYLDEEEAEYSTDGEIGFICEEHGEENKNEIRKTIAHMKRNLPSVPQNAQNFKQDKFIAQFYKSESTDEKIIEMLQNFLDGKVFVNGQLMKINIYEMHVNDDKKAYINVTFNSSDMKCT